MAVITEKLGSAGSVEFPVEMHEVQNGKGQADEIHDDAKSGRENGIIGDGQTDTQEQGDGKEGQTKQHGQKQGKPAEDEPEAVLGEASGCPECNYRTDGC